jgi:hypothetical protein
MPRLLTAEAKAKRVADVRKGLAKGLTIRQIVGETGIAKATVQTIKKQIDAEDAPRFSENEKLPSTFVIEFEEHAAGTHGVPLPPGARRHPDPDLEMVDAELVEPNLPAVIQSAEHLHSAPTSEYEWLALANKHHDEGVATSLFHAWKSGEALNHAHVLVGKRDWKNWLGEDTATRQCGFHGGYRLAATYMQLAREFKSEAKLPAGESINGALKAIRAKNKNKDKDKDKPDGRSTRDGYVAVVRQIIKLAEMVEKTRLDRPSRERANEIWGELADPLYVITDWLRCLEGYVGEEMPQISAIPRRGQ